MNARIGLNRRPEAVGTSWDGFAEVPRQAKLTSKKLHRKWRGAQFVHCLEFDSGVKGGAVTMLDAFAAAEHFRDNFPEHFEVIYVYATTVLVYVRTNVLSGFRGFLPLILKGSNEKLSFQLHLFLGEVFFSCPLR